MPRKKGHLSVAIIYFTSRLSLGKVNEFGIFEPVFEPEPDRGNGTSKGAYVLTKDKIISQQKYS